MFCIWIGVNEASFLPSSVVFQWWSNITKLGWSMNSFCGVILEFWNAWYPVLWAILWAWSNGAPTMVLRISQMNRIPPVPFHYYKFHTNGWEIAVCENCGPFPIPLILFIHFLQRFRWKRVPDFVHKRESILKKGGVMKIKA